MYKAYTSPFSFRPSTCQGSNTRRCSAVDWEHCPISRWTNRCSALDWEHCPIQMNKQCSAVDWEHCPIQMNRQMFCCGLRTLSYPDEQTDVLLWIENIVLSRWTDRCSAVDWEHCPIQMNRQMFCCGLRTLSYPDEQTDVLLWIENIVLYPDEQTDVLLWIENIVLSRWTNNVLLWIENIVLSRWTDRCSAVDWEHCPIQMNKHVEHFTSISNESWRTVVKVSRDGLQTRPYHVGCRWRQTPPSRTPRVERCRPRVRPNLIGKGSPGSDPL